jgi:hypothetical protein
MKFDMDLDEEAHKFMTEIATDIMQRFGLTEEDAVGRLNECWKGKSVKEPYFWLLYHEEPAFWSQTLYYEAHDFWRPQQEKAKALGLTLSELWEMELKDVQEARRNKSQ